MRFWLTLATAGMAVAGANAMGAARLTAQETPDELTGCYDLTVGPWVVETYYEELRPHFHGEFPEWFRLPPRIEFAGPHDQRPSETRIAFPESDSAAFRHYLSRMTGARMEGDSLRLGFSTGYTGVIAIVGRSGDGWVGNARSFIDVVPHQVHTRPVAMSQVDCESPLPVPGDESHPLARVVELEGGQVITLGEPLPEQLETVALPPFEWTWPSSLAPGELMTPRNAVGVVGRTRGLFGTTDVIHVHTDPDGLVYSVRLLYVDSEALETLEERLRGQYGAPGTRSGVQDVQIYRSPNTSLWLRPSPAAQAEVLLSDRGR
ncbi:MAG: hypothetical protein F4237_02380 [Gemmatimonadetes bacterium]|nr:hypothetical protein [Gemmatimonadota bacterium]